MEAVIREAGMPAKEAKDLCFILGAAAEGIIYQALVRGTPDLNKLAGNANTLSETIAKMWYRSIFLEAPGNNDATESERFGDSQVFVAGIDCWSRWLPN